MQESNAARDYTFITLSLLVAMLLTVLPLPAWAVWARPQWTFMVLLFWVMTMPERIGVGLAFVIGLLMDLLTGTVLGQHALSYTIVIYLLMKFHPQLHLFPLWQQLLIVLTLVMLNLALQYCVFAAMGITPAVSTYWWSAVSSTLLWPWVSIFLRESQLRL